MRSRHPLLLALVLLTTASGCDQLKKKLGKGAGADGGAVATAEADASTAAAAAAADGGAVAAAEPAPKNAAGVARFGNENALDTAATIKRAGVRVTTAIPTGTEVATLAAGTAVKQVAERGGFYRITFADPKAPADRLTGWVDKLAFVEATAPAAAKTKKPIKCTGGTVLAGSDENATPTCSKPCSDDKECGGGECQGAFTFDEQKLVMNALPGARTMVCVGGAKPGAAAAKTDAGAGAAWKVGDAVQVEWRGSWYPAKVIALGNGKYRVHYDGYGPEWDEFVGPSRIKKR